MVVRELSFSRLECGVHDRLHIYPLCGIFYFPWHRHQIEGTNGFYCLIRKTERFTISNVESHVFTPNNSRLDPGSNPGCPRDKSYHWTNCTIRCRPVVMSKNRPDVSKMSHGFFITINGDTGSCLKFNPWTHGFLLSDPWKSSRFAAVDRRSAADKQLHSNGVIHSACVAQCQELSPKT